MLGMLAPLIETMHRYGYAKVLFFAMCVYSVVFAVAQGGNASYGYDKMRVAQIFCQPVSFRMPRPQGNGELASPGRSDPPGFVFVLAALAKVDRNLASGLLCAAQDPKSCPPERQFFSLVLLQAFLGLSIFFSAYRLFRSLAFTEETAYFALLLFIFTFRVGDLIRVTTGQIFEVALLLAHIALVVAWYDRKRIGFGHCIGVTLGLATLFGPIYIVLLAFELPLLLWATLRRELAPLKIVLGALALTVACLATVARGPFAISKSLGILGSSRKKRLTPWQPEPLSMTLLSIIGCWPSSAGFQACRTTRRHSLCQRL